MTNNYKEIGSPEEARSALTAAWPAIVGDCRSVLGSELHYQAMVYHCLRTAGVSRDQLGMNVKQFIEAPVSTLFRSYQDRRAMGFQGGFETIPDVAVFSPAISGDWRRRNRASTLRHLLLAIEIKASERDKGRLGPGEITNDISKLAAHREEVGHLGGHMQPVMMVIDTAPEVRERMTERSRAAAQTAAKNAGVSFFYLSPATEIATP